MIRKDEDVMTQPLHNNRQPAAPKLKGPGYLAAGFRLLSHPDIRWFVLAPLLINLLIFAGLSILIVDQFSALMDKLMGFLPGWLDFLAWIIWVIFAALLLVVYGYSFAIVGNLLASPFYGIMAEKISAMETPGKESPPLTFQSVLAIAGRSFVRELKKLLYFLPRIIAVLLVTFILSLVPPLSLLSPIIVFVWGGWSLALQYLDYGADNSEVSFTQLKQGLATQRIAALSFGGSALILTSIPVLNLLAIPASVAGAMVMWERQTKSVCADAKS